MKNKCFSHEEVKRLQGMGKYKITMLAAEFHNPATIITLSNRTKDLVQEWGEEVEEGAVYGVTLNREPVQSPPDLEDASLSKGCIQYRTCKVRRLKVATLDRLVAELLNPVCQEPNYRRIFLSMYQAFTNTSTLIKLLFQRDDTLSKLDNSDCQKSAMLSLLQTWLDDHSGDFWDPPQHHALHLLSAHLLCRPFLSHLAKRASELLRKFQEEENSLQEKLFQLEEAEVSEQQRTGEINLSWDNTDEQVDFMQFPVRDIAEQLTRFDVELFTKVVPFQCVGCVWSQRDKKENLAPTVRATIAQFNAVTNWVITSLLCQPVGMASPTHQLASCPSHRARVIEKWISVAQECRRLKNFSSLKAILSALQSNAVYRLKKTWAAVGREYVATFENLCETFPDENCVLTNREILVEEKSQSAQDSAIQQPLKLCSQQMGLTGGVVPYLGTYLTVLTMLDTALPDTVEGGLINFEKRRREFEILDQICHFQQSCSWYSLPQHHQVFVWLNGCRPLSDQESYELSQELEPPADTCPCPPTSWSHRLLTKKLASLLTMGDGSSSKAHADQISMSSSGSSSSEMEDLSSPQSSPGREKFPSSSCQDEAETSSSTGSQCSVSSGSQSDSLPCSPNSSNSDSRPGLRHKHSASTTSLPLYNRQVDDCCIVRVSVEYENNGNMYKSILLTSQDKTVQVIQRALEKHSLEGMTYHDFSLIQLLPNDKELRMPDKANVFYAMSTSANYDFILRRRWRSHLRPLGCASTSKALKFCHHAK